MTSSNPFFATSGDSFCSLPRQQQFELARSLWPEILRNPDAFDEKSYTEFFKYLDTIRSQLGHVREKRIVGTFEDIMQLSQIWKSLYDQPLSKVIQIVSPQFLYPDDNSIQRALEFSVRLLLTINVNSRSITWGHVAPHEKPLQWATDMSLKSLLEGRFVSDRVRQPTMPFRMEGHFTAAYLVNICGLRLNWTDTLSDHLRPDPHRQVLTVYKHKICLNNHLRGPSPIHQDILKEALNTLILLFPLGDTPTQQLLEREGRQDFHGLGNCGGVRELDLSRYEYWREELETLVNIFHHPRTWKHLFMDRRNLTEWAAFWMTAMVALLTLVSIPCNIIQAAYSVKSYHVSVSESKDCSC